MQLTNTPCLDIIGRRNGGSAMNNLKNLAGNDASIFLFRFEVFGNGISFVLNEGIASDMYEDVDEKLKPLAHACCETLVRYKHLSVSTTIMDGTILATGEFEVRHPPPSGWLDEPGRLKGGGVPSPYSNSLKPTIIVTGIVVTDIRFDLFQLKA